FVAHREEWQHEPPLRAQTLPQTRTGRVQSRDGPADHPLRPGARKGDYRAAGRPAGKWLVDRGPLRSAKDGPMSTALETGRDFAREVLPPIKELVRLADQVAELDPALALKMNRTIREFLDVLPPATKRLTERVFEQTKEALVQAIEE